MKRTVTLNQTLDEEISDSLSTSAPNSSHNYLEEPSLSSRNTVSETDSISDASRKIRKKRNAYQKISDEIRMDLLHSVRNGETLKSAAKRHKINYSSAKSILHTYRKEGRILKKSAQERSSTKKKAPDSVETEDSKPAKASRQQKKANASKAPLRQSLRVAISASNTDKVKTESVAQDEESLQSSTFVETTVSSFEPLYKVECLKQEEMQAHHMTLESHGMPKKEEEAQRCYTYENNYTNFSEGGVDYMFAEAPQTMLNFMPSFTGFGDFTTNWYNNRSRVHDNYYDPSSFLCMRGADDKVVGCETGIEYQNDHIEGYESYPLREFMDAQNIMMRNSVTNYNENKTGMRKSSLDFF